MGTALGWRLTLAVGLFVLTVAWAAAIILTPRLARADSRVLQSAAAATYVIGSGLCHQRADRSFHIDGVPLPVCARCTALYVAAPVGLLVALASLPRPRAGGRGERRARLMVLAALAPTVATALLELTGLWQPSGMIRALAAGPLGATTAWVAGAALRGNLR